MRRWWSGLSAPTAALAVLSTFCGPDLAAGARSWPRRPRRSRRLAPQHVDPGLGRRAPSAPPHRIDRLVRILERQHLPPRSARARLVGTPVRTGAADPADLLADRQHHPLLQPALHFDVRALGIRNLPPRPRSHRRQARGVHCGTRLRVPAISNRVGAARSGDELAVDAVCVCTASIASLRLDLAGRWSGEPRRW